MGKDLRPGTGMEIFSKACKTFEVWLGGAQGADKPTGRILSEEGRSNPTKIWKVMDRAKIRAIQRNLHLVKISKGAY